MTIVKRIGDHDLPLPKQETMDAAGYDLRTTECFTLWPGQRKLISTGFAWALPDGFMGLIRPRSGLAVKHGLHVMAGLLDSDYRGELKVLLVNLGEQQVNFVAGDRVAQMVVTMHYQGHLSEVDELPKTVRGDGGFGSTGTN